MGKAHCGEGGCGVATTGRSSADRQVSQDSDIRPITESEAITIRAAFWRVLKAATPEQYQ
ncbi:MAG: hypothetical protein KJ077_24885 [Anaerolineae bacterium]|nr:hypothetical protein [Anaerolineae bacterium]